MSTDCNWNENCYGFSWISNPAGSVVTGTGCTLTCYDSEDYNGWGDDGDFYVKAPEDYNNYWRKYKSKIPNYGSDACYEEIGQGNFETMAYYCDQDEDC